jgi:co-chaperonin GroES (HSP10)
MDRFTKLEPWGAHALVRVLTKEEMTVSQFVHKTPEGDQPTEFAEVIEVGEELGGRIGAGDFVLLRRYAGSDVIFNSSKLLAVRKEEIVGRAHQNPDWTGKEEPKREFVPEMIEQVN